MKDRRVVWWVLSVLLAISVVGMIAGGAHLLGYDPGPPPGPTAVLVGHRAPGFDLPLVSGPGAAEGDRLSLAALSGRVVLLDFWASWCVPCRQSIPALNTVHERYRGQPIEMIGVNVESGVPRGIVAGAHREFGARFRSVQDEDGLAQGMYHVSSIPTLVLIDRSGTVRWVETGVPDPDEVAEQVDQLLH